MANHPKISTQDVFIMIGAVSALCVTAIAGAPSVLPMILKPTPTAIQAPTSALSILSKQPFAETSAIPTVTSTIMPTDTPSATFTPTYATQQLPDLTVGSISTPTCRRDHLLTAERDYVIFSIIVRNVGAVSTRSFGPFSVRVNLIFGQQRYDLDTWAASFNGVIDSSNMDIPNLNTSDDVKLNLAIDLKGNTNFGIEVIANSGPNPIPESNTDNNLLIQNFSVICV